MQIDSDFGFFNQGDTKLGRKRKTSNKRNTQKKLNIDLAIVTLIMLSILLFVLIYGEKGAIGEVLSPMLGGIMGFIKYLVPIGTLAIAISMARDDRNYIISKLVELIILLACIATMLTIFQISKGNISTDLEFSKALEVAYDLGEKNIGGGTVGAVMALPLIKLFGMFGAAIAAIGVSMILLVFIFGIEPSRILRAIIEKAEDEKVMREENGRDARVRNIAEERVSRIPNKKHLHSETISEPIEEQITINLNDDKAENTKQAEEPKFKFFGKDKKVDVEKQNPEELDNLFKEEKEEKEDKTKAVLNLAHNEVSIEDENYEFPPIELLKMGQSKSNKTGKKMLADTATRLQKTLYSFGVSAKVENVSVGPAITRYELKPAEGVRVSKIAKLSDDIALNLAAESIRIEAPIPGKQAVGIEIPNTEKQVVHLRDIIDSPKFEDAESTLSMGLGKDIAGDEVVADIAKMPHVLIAGSTGSGKSVCINTLIMSILYKAKPSEVKLLMVDPKVVELSVYNGIPHLLIPVVTDPKKAAGALAWAVQEMENRYQLFAKKNVRDLKGYNEVIEAEMKAGRSELEEKYDQGKLPKIVIIIDELADLMMVASKDVEDAICRLAQKARAAGMHLVIATQRPSVDVITGIIKANVPSRIAFAVSSQVDSRTILDMAGAEKLLGKGDMLFYPIGASKPVRIQGSFVSDKEVENIVDFIKKDGVSNTEYSQQIIEQIENSMKSDKEKAMELEDGDDDTDPLLTEAIEMVIDMGQASTSMVQRKLKVGYARAGRIIDQMEERGIISGFEGSKPRQVLITRERWQELNMTKPPEENQDEQ